ncbi:MAG: type IV secretory system conjugative DNA transfer family protein, partial [Allomuricauda sp.]
MYVDHLFTVLSIIGLTSALFFSGYQLSNYAFWVNNLLLFALVYFLQTSNNLVLVLLNVVCPLLLINTALYVFLHKRDNSKNSDHRYQVDFKTTNGYFKLDNIKRGASIIGSAGSGKTESVVYGFLKHFRKEGFCGIIHDYKDFELTEMAYPLFKDGDIPFKVISFDNIIHRVNPIAPRY